MRVLMIRNPAASVGCKLQEGEIGTVPDALGRVLVDAHLAECLDSGSGAPTTTPAESIKAVPPEPEISGEPDDSEEPVAGKPETTKTKTAKK